MYIHDAFFIHSSVGTTYADPCFGYCDSCSNQQGCKVEYHSTLDFLEVLLINMFKNNGQRVLLSTPITPLHKVT